jgi:hypothetical protein
MGHSLTEPIVFDFKTGISPDKAERVISALGAEEQPSRSVVLTFKDYPYVNTGVAWRIGNALRRYSGEPLEVTVPAFAEGQGGWFRSFTKTGLGDALAAHAGKILSDGEDITAQVRSYYAEKQVRKSNNSVFWGGLHQAATVNPEREDLYRDEFIASLKFVNVRPTHFDRERLQDLIKLSFEAIQNVYDHARRKPLPEGTRVFSYALLGYFKSIEDNHPDPDGRLKTYLTRLPSLTSRARKDFIEICVNDDGVGIAARHSQDPAIYWGPLTRETETVLNALTAHSSVKLRSQDSRVRGVPGQGYTYIDSCLRAVRAFAILRTGRLLAVFDGTADTNVGFSLVPGDLGYMPGTTLNVLIPILKDGDGLPSLFADD